MQHPCVLCFIRCSSVWPRCVCTFFFTWHNASTCGPDRLSLRITNVSTPPLSFHPFAGSRSFNAPLVKTRIPRFLSSRILMIFFPLFPIGNVLFSYFRAWRHFSPLFLFSSCPTGWVVVLCALIEPIYPFSSIFIKFCFFHFLFDCLIGPVVSFYLSLFGP